MAYANRNEAAKVLEVSLGLDNGGSKDGIYLGMRVSEQHTHQSSWRSKPTGKFYVTFYPEHPGRYTRDKMFKTLIGKDNEFDIDVIKEYVNAVIVARKATKAAEATKQDIKGGNKPIAERVRASANRQYVYDYRSQYGGCSVVPSETAENTVNINWEFKLNEEKALRLMAFINDLEGE